MRERCLRIGSAGKTFSFTSWKVRGVRSVRGRYKALGCECLLSTLSMLARLPVHTAPVCLPACLQVGWLTGPRDMIAAVAKAHQFVTFTVPSALQVRRFSPSRVVPVCHSISLHASPFASHFLNLRCRSRPLQRAVAHGLEHEQRFYCSLGAVMEGKRQLLAAQLAGIGFAVLPAAGTYFLVADFAPLLPLGSTEDDVQARLGGGEAVHQTLQACAGAEKSGPTHPPPHVPAVLLPADGRGGRDTHPGLGILRRQGRRAPHPRSFRRLQDRRQAADRLRQAAPVFQRRRRPEKLASLALLRITL